ncbi:MAG: PemK-like protein [Acidobacteria bacterium]|nr:PemK-like protein [Acidobacteriota bacterium]
MKRGEVYWADLAPRSGSEQQGRRPVVVISHDAFNQTQNWRSIIVVPLSTSVARKPGAGLPLCCCHKAQQVSAKTVLRSVIK